MIANDDSSVVSEQSFQLIDDARGVIYDRRMFIIQATEMGNLSDFVFLSHCRENKGRRQMTRTNVGRFNVPIEF
jgi:hypothetical protein